MYIHGKIDKLNTAVMSRSHYWPSLIRNFEFLQVRMVTCTSDCLLTIILDKWVIEVVCSCNTKNFEIVIQSDKV